MPNTSWVVILLLLTSLPLPNHAWAQSGKAKPDRTQRMLSLTPANNGQHLYASVGQIIQVDLQALGSVRYTGPEISAPNIQYRNSILFWPPNPGGSLPYYLFEATSPGVARIQMPRNGGPGFDVTIDVRPAVGNPSNHVILDQANTAGGTQAWTTLANTLQQNFIPSLPKLTNIEVELTVANPGPSQGVISLMLLNADGQGILEADKTVTADDCAHVRFVLPPGFEVSPGKTYSIQLSGGEGLFGWKYMAGGYNRGDASFNGKPLLKDARSTFLFRTFGMR